jgi:hypothetical protein
MNTTLWETIDEPMLRWVAARPPSLDVEIHQFPLREPEPFPDVDGLDSRDANESLLRLQSANLIDGIHGRTMGGDHWTELRVTAHGWIVLGEWPDLDRVATAASIHRLLRALADDAPEDDATALRRAAGVASRTVDAVVRDALAEVAHGAGEELA